MLNFTYKKLEAIVNSYWDSLPKQMQDELRDFYGDNDDVKQEKDTI